MLKQAAVIAAGVAKRRSALSRRADATVQTPSSKRPRQEAEPAYETPRPPKRVKKLAKKGEHEVHVMSSQTTKVTTHVVPLTAPVTEERPIPVGRASQASPVPEAVKPVAVQPSLRQLNQLLLRWMENSQPQ